MKKYNVILIAGILLLTACQAKQPQAAGAQVSTAQITDAALAQSSQTEEIIISNRTEASEIQPEVPDSSEEDESGYKAQDVAGIWQINGQKTQDVNELSLLEEFGSGIHEGNEMILSEQGDFSYYMGINQGGSGTWKLEGNKIIADITTYEPEVKEERLIMTAQSGPDGCLLLKMICADGYILYWNRLEEPESADVPVIPQSEVMFDGYPEQTDYASIASLSAGAVQETEGTYGGSPVIWSPVNDGTFLHFYYTFTYPEKLQPEYAGYAITGENIELACGLRVGMTAEEAEAIIPGMYHFVWDNTESVSALDWNENMYLDSWCRQFPQILIAQVDNGSEMPLTIGLMLDQQKIIKAIAFNYLTAG